MYHMHTYDAQTAISTLPSTNKAQQLWLVDPTHREYADSHSHLMICGLPALGMTTCYVLQGPVDSMNALKHVSNTLTQVTTKYHGLVAQSLYNEHT